MNEKGKRKFIFSSTYKDEFRKRGCIYWFECKFGEDDG